MFRKVIYLVKSNLHYYPPCMAQIQMLDDLGIEVEVWYGSSASNALEILSKRGIKLVSLSDKRLAKRGKLDSLLNWLNFRSKTRQMLHSVNPQGTILWFGNVETLIPMMGLLGRFHYITSILELLDDKANDWKRALAMGPVRRADAVIACQRTRAYIMRSWWKLDTVPYVMPNKPYHVGLPKNCQPSCELTGAYLRQFAGKKIVLFQGILQHVQYLGQFARALRELDDDYLLVLMGSDERDKTLVGKVQAIYADTVHIPYIPAPSHLEITSHAHIGIVFYKDDSLNRAYCAPNKIYEYAHFGIPMIGNRIPGLQDTVGLVHAAECIELTAEQIVQAIRRIEANYAQYSQNASQFFADTDNYAVMQEIIQKCGIDVRSA